MDCELGRALLESARLCEMAGVRDLIFSGLYQYRTRRGGKARRSAGRLAHSHRLFVIAARIGGKNLVRRRPRRQRHQQHSQDQRKPHFRNSPFKALRIIAAVWAQPNKAAKEPKRGPWAWPSSTS